MISVAPTTSVPVAVLGEVEPAIAAVAISSSSSPTCCPQNEDDEADEADENDANDEGGGHKLIGGGCHFVVNRCFDNPGQTLRVSSNEVEVGPSPHRFIAPQFHNAGAL